LTIPKMNACRACIPVLHSTGRTRSGGTSGMQAPPPPPPHYKYSSELQAGTLTAHAKGRPHMPRRRIQAVRHSCAHGVHKAPHHHVCCSKGNPSFPCPVGRAPVSCRPHACMRTHTCLPHATVAAPLLARAGVPLRMVHTCKGTAVACVQTARPRTHTHTHIHTDTHTHKHVPPCVGTTTWS
jgi:hypothetical protein